MGDFFKMITENPDAIMRLTMGVIAIICLFALVKIAHSRFDYNNNRDIQKDCKYKESKK